MNIAAASLQIKHFEATRTPYQVEILGDEMSVTESTPEAWREGCVQQYDAMRQFCIAKLRDRSITHEMSEGVDSLIYVVNEAMKRHAKPPTPGTVQKALSVFQSTPKVMPNDAISKQQLALLERRLFAMRLGPDVDPNDPQMAPDSPFRKFLKANALHSRFQRLKLHAPKAGMLPFPTADGKEVRWVNFESLERVEIREDHPLNQSLEREGIREDNPATSGKFTHVMRVKAGADTVGAFDEGEELFCVNEKNEFKANKLSEPYNVLHRGIVQSDAIMGPIPVMEVRDPQEWGGGNVIRMCVAFVQHDGTPTIGFGDHSYIEMMDKDGNVYSVGVYGRPEFDALLTGKAAKLTKIPGWPFGKRNPFGLMGNAPGKTFTPDSYSVMPHNQYKVTHLNVRVSDEQFKQAFAHMEEEHARNRDTSPHAQVPTNLLMDNCTSWATRHFEQMTGVQVFHHMTIGENMFRRWAPTLLIRGMDYAKDTYEGWTSGLSPSRKRLADRACHYNPFVWGPNLFWVGLGKTIGSANVVRGVGGERVRLRRLLTNPGANRFASPQQAAHSCRREVKVAEREGRLVEGATTDMKVIDLTK
ncbi:MAG: hypothetical protein S4CHLAM102_16150 [Chlamydiia bacterium]|nr:hypothetical protein [Chlamydiia bacterium]